mmetsp:Transcript_12469/g.23436  ORF Transcript_12469/g.23436 Transcript_12469/m.23436 type:complete len:267 (-) Transcript_12469:382-1182(-)|eukprot:CAMPEP_0197457456 /NCGR_PEP_ID=MMETSP1175-20131217/46095_1 /TAXON_ID=1003142 /ORGANISM="Triceratium dubium, Strain CCMP147" /LENGTH=266 /DNA_ID=CAMNT_0042991835 /DNA_START=34 /DNA_END=834 /DNA_ORIENTATION=+
MPLPSLDEQNSARLLRPRTLYFIRHGEALHNILEKKAKAKAKEDAIAEGFAPDDEETHMRMEVARMGVLNDDTLLDAPLSEAGEKEAEGARVAVERLISEKDLPPPTEVLVSPLQRALQTADLIFPHHDNIRVREEVRERLTGKACDTRTSSHEMAKRDSFKRFSMRRMMQASIARRSSDTENDAKEKVENKYQLRERTRKLFNLIAEESDHEVLAVVTHKGFLRELERGPFGNADATEFSNCEVRVYKASFIEGSLEVAMAERVA